MLYALLFAYYALWFLPQHVRMHDSKDLILSDISYTKSAEIVKF